MMRDAARALDDVSDHLGEVLRRADELLADWSRFGAQVRSQVERETAAIAEVVEGAIGRAGAAGVDRAIGDRLRALTVELERLEQRARAASRAAAEQRNADRRILWGVVAGIVLANALLVVLILRRPDAPPVPEAIRIDLPPAPVQPASEATPTPTPDPPSAAPAGAATTPTTAAGGAGASNGAATGVTAGSGSTTGAAGANPTAASASAAVRPAGAASQGGGQNGAQNGGQNGGTNGAPTGGRSAEPASVKSAPIALPPPRPGAPHPHKKRP